MSQLPQNVPNSRYGIWSFAIAVFILSLNALMLTFLLYVRLTATSAEAVLAFAGTIGGIDFMAWLGSLFGLAWGVIGLFPRTRKKTLAVWGVMLNGAFFFGLILFGVAMSMSK